MKRTLLKGTALFALIASAFIFSGCMSAKELQKRFVRECYKENRGLPMSQIDMLYIGYRDHEDTSAYGSLDENCPGTVKKYIK